MIRAGGAPVPVIQAMDQTLVLQPLAHQLGTVAELDFGDGQVAALQRLFGHPSSFTVNLGTGRGYSVLEVVSAYSQACGRELPIEFAPRRAGDIAACWADPTLAHRLLGWRARHDLARMCADSWRWQSLNPNGFESA